MYIMEKLLKDKFSIFAFVTAGYPTVDKSIDILLALEKSNVVDVVELGINFSECTADGPVLESCGEIARQNGTNSIFKCLDILKEARKRGFNLPVVLMGYINSFKDGWLEYCKDMISGVIVVDLPVEEKYTYKFMKLCEKNNISFIPIVTSETSNERVKKINNLASTYIYCVSVLGITGVRNFSDNYFQKYKEIYDRINKNVLYSCLIGFGISNNKTVRAVMNTGAQGCVIGTAIMKKIIELKDEDNFEDKFITFLRNFFIISNYSVDGEDV